MPNPATESPPAPNLTNYTDNHDGTVTDNVTGLMWESPAPDGGVVAVGTWGPASDSQTAQHYCATLALAGHNDWRLPSSIELVSLLDPTAPSGPLINTTYFPNTGKQGFWSATITNSINSPAGPRLWWVDFTNGNVLAEVGSSSTILMPVRCVR
jgi:hypothetical protein